MSRHPLVIEFLDNTSFKLTWPNWNKMAYYPHFSKLQELQLLKHENKNQISNSIQRQYMNNLALDFLLI